MLLIAFFDTSTRINSLFAKNKYAVIFKFLNLTSYAVYLIHAIIFDRLEIVVNDYFENAGLAFGIWLVAVILVFVLAHLSTSILNYPFLSLEHW